MTTPQSPEPADRLRTSRRMLAVIGLYFTGFALGRLALLVVKSLVTPVADGRPASAGGW